MSRPFTRVPFAHLPELPRKPHDLAVTRECDLPMNSRPFGSMRIRYREYGSGPPLLLIHGLMTTNYSWRYVYRSLGANFRVIAPDLPGSGRSDKPQNHSYRLAAFAEWIGEFQRELDIEGCAAIGNSLGGLICMVHAAKNPGSFSKLVNIHSPGAPGARYTALHLALRTIGARALLMKLIARDPGKWVWRNVHYYDETLKSLEETNIYAEPLSTDEGREAFFRYLFETMDPAGFSLFRETMTNLDHRFPMPLLLLYSRTDPLVPPKTGDYMATLIKNAKLVWLENTSHFAHVDRPDPVVSEVLSFLRQ